VFTTANNAILIALIRVRMR